MGLLLYTGSRQVTCQLSGVFAGKKETIDLLTKEGISVPFIVDVASTKIRYVSFSIDVGVG